MAAGCAGMADTPTIAAETIPPSYEATFFEAQLQIISNDYAGAIESLKPLSEKEDCPPEILLSLADAYRLSRDNESAAETVKKAAELYPSYIPAWQMKSEISRRKGDIEGAITDLENALGLEPNNGEMLEKVGLLRLQNTKSWDYKENEDSPIGKIIDIYTRLLNLRQGSDRVMPLLVLASVYTQVGKHDEAIKSAKEAVDLRPSDMRAQVSLAEAYEEAGKNKDALSTYRQALLIEPNNAAVRKKIAGLVSSLGSPGGVMAFYQDLAESFPRILEIQDTYGDELVKAEEWAKAAEHFKKALELWPDNAKFKALRVRALLKLGKDDEALALAKALLDDPAVGDPDLLQLSDSLRAAGKLDMVIDLVKRLAESRKHEPRLMLYLANVQIEAKKPADAIKTLEFLTRDLGALMDQRPAGFLVVATLGKLYVDAQNFDKAHKLYDRAREESAKKPQGKEQATDLLLMKATLYRQEKKNDEAISVLEGILGSGEKAPDTATRMFADIFESSQSYPEAHAALDRIIAKSPEGKGTVQARRLKAYFYWRERDYPKAIEIMEKLHQAAPGDLDMLQFLAENYLKAGQFDEANAAVAGAEGKVAPEQANDLSVLKARVFREQKRWDEAIAIIEGLIRENEESEEYRLLVSDYYQQAGRLDEAEKSLRKVMEINPANAEAYNALGYFFAESGVKLDEALELVQKALELDPGKGHILDSLGWVYYKKGEYSKAVEALEMAVSKLAEPDPVVLEHLGDAYQKAGRADKAKQIWREALRLDPKAEGIRGKLGE